MNYDTIAFVCVAAKWPPDSPPQFFPQNWPHDNIDDYGVDARSFGNEKSNKGNGNDLFDKQIVAERTWRDLFHTNKVADPAAEEIPQQKLQRLGSWLFGKQITQKQQQQIQEYKPSQGRQQQQLWNDNRKESTSIFLYKKVPEIWPYEDDKNSIETDVIEKDVNGGQTKAEDVEKGDVVLNTLWNNNYKGDKQSITDQLMEESLTPNIENNPFARIRRLDYAYIPFTAYKSEQERKLKEAKKTADNERRNFLPSISAGAIAHLGNFFTDLSKNVHYNEKMQPSVHPQAKFLEGQHPLRQLHEKMTGKHEANAEFIHDFRTYRPSQKIRSLVSMNPRGYHGAQFIDPNYMWVGLGK
ncbi:uncharacterized protein [Eurosta solidaginis]|uniref:uncharacterized protein n=1 Tax=Eurosta solidaginis TaxID=178769 RepID=UPI003531296C